MVRRHLAISRKVEENRALPDALIAAPRVTRFFSLSLSFASSLYEHGRNVQAVSGSSHGCVGFVSIDIERIAC